MSGWNILVTAPRACAASDLYRAALEPRGCRLTMRPSDERHVEADLLPLVADIDAMICGDDEVTRRVLEAAPRLRMIAKWGTGIDSIDRNAALERGVQVCNTPDAFSEPVADTVLAYLLLFARQPVEMTEDMRAGRWVHRPLVALHECTLGLVGFGHIGRAVARRAAAFRMPMVTYDVRPIADEASSLGVRVTGLDELLTQSDFVSLHADSRFDNRHLIDARRLRLMRPSAVLVNTARGALVDEDALADALREGRLAGAALDVFDQEPLSAASPLRSLSNVHLAPHNSNSSPFAAASVHASTIGHVLRGIGALMP